jgi:hypothetical protein
MLSKQVINHGNQSRVMSGRDKGGIQELELLKTVAENTGQGNKC